MPSWMDTVLQRPSSSPSKSPSHASSPKAAATVSETTAPGQADLVRLAAPHSPAPTQQRLGDRPSNATLPSPPSRATPQQCDVAMLERLEELAVQVNEARAQTESLARRGDLHMVIMEGLVHNAVGGTRRASANVPSLEPELRLAATMGEEYLARAQELEGRPAVSSSTNPSLRETFTMTPSPRQASQARSSVEVATWTPAGRDNGRQLSCATSSSQRAQPGPVLLSAGEGSGSRMRPTSDAGLSSQTGWTPINSRDLAHTDEQEDFGSDYSDDDDGESSRSQTEVSSLGPSSPSNTRPRYSISRQTYPRYARGPPDQPFHYTRMPRTVVGIWNQWKHGTDGNEAIEALEREYGTSWRTGGNRDIKYGSNYVGTRHRIVQYIETRAMREGVPPEELCRRLDAHVDKRIQQLLSAIKKDQDPFVVIERR
ncbi:hypothetical protein HJFPF1_08747 [Paramyrothecium foliicola]|nr:hypothetical protein HJFPF1_08747 [Paramyrothecium foliicola]